MNCRRVEDGQGHEEMPVGHGAELWVTHQGPECALDRLFVFQPTYWPPGLAVSSCGSLVAFEVAMHFSRREWELWMGQRQLAPHCDAGTLNSTSLSRRPHALHLSACRGQHLPLSSPPIPKLDQDTASYPGFLLCFCLWECWTGLCYPIFSLGSLMRSLTATRSHREPCRDWGWGSGISVPEGFCSAWPVPDWLIWVWGHAEFCPLRTFFLMALLIYHNIHPFIYFSLN